MCTLSKVWACSGGEGLRHPHLHPTQQHHPSACTPHSSTTPLPAPLPRWPESGRPSRPLTSLYRPTIRWYTPFWYTPATTDSSEPRTSGWTACSWARPPAFFVGVRNSSSIIDWASAGPGRLCFWLVLEIVAALSTLGCSWARPPAFFVGVRNYQHYQHWAAAGPGHLRFLLVLEIVAALSALGCSWARPPAVGVLQYPKP